MICWHKATAENIWAGLESESIKATKYQGAGGQWPIIFIYAGPFTILKYYSTKNNDRADYHYLLITTVPIFEFNNDVINLNGSDIEAARTNEINK